MRHLLCLAFVVSLGSAFVGCSQGVPEEVITVSAANDPFFEPRSILERYKAGQKPGSEQSSFEALVNNVKAVDPAKAEILASGFEEIRNAKSPAAIKKIATELLGKIAPAVGPAAE